MRSQLIFQAARDDSYLWDGQLVRSGQMHEVQKKKKACGITSNCPSVSKQPTHLH